MKFLTITSLRDSASMLPPAVSRQLLEATINYMNQLKQAGKILEMYSLAGCERSAVISEFDSAEELAKDVAALPFGPLIKNSLVPMPEPIKEMLESATPLELVTLMVVLIL